MMLGLLVGAVLGVGLAPVSVSCPADTEPRGALPPQGTEQWCVRQTDEGKIVRHGPLRAWHPDGRVRVEAEFCSDVRCGRFAEWHPNGKPKTLGELDALGRRQGHWVEWAPDGKVSLEADYLDDEVVPRAEASIAQPPAEAPRAQAYFPESMPPPQVVAKVAGNTPAARPYEPLKCPKGAVMGGEEYPRGLVQWCQLLDPSGKWVRHGVLREWYPNGQRRSESDYVRGRTTGWVTRWYPNGQKAEETHYRVGVPDGQSTRWNEDGQMIRREVYERGRLVSVQRGAVRLLPAPP